MAKIIGTPIATPVPKSDWKQTDPTKPDYIKNKPTIISEEGVDEKIATAIQEHNEEVDAIFSSTPSSDIIVGLFFM